MQNNFSDWFKIDLHIHTDLSKTTKDGDYKGEFSIQVAKSKLIENDVKICSFTDHNVINISAYNDYYAAYNTETDPLLLLGIELDIKVNRGARERIYHTLLIFDIDDIESVRSISDKLEAKYTELGIIDLTKRTLTIENIVELFPDVNYFFIPHAYSDKNIVTAYKDGAIKEAQKMVLLMQCALEKVAKPETIAAYELGFNTLLSKNFKSQKDIPYINFSDNHCIVNYPCRHKGDNNVGNHEFYYIKGSKCFESIRLAFIDPESRIKTTTDFNSINHTNNTIDIVSIKNNNIIKDIDLRFSPHLNVIIGGRSSGKSLLMWLLGKKIDTLNLDNKYEKVDLQSIQIKARQDATNKDSTSLQHNFIYIKQGDIINYFEAGELKELAKKSNKSTEYNDALMEFKDYKRELEDVQSVFTTNYKNAHDLGISNQYILHGATINNILSSHFILKFDKNKILKEVDITEDINVTEELLERLKSDVTNLSTNELLEFSDDDVTIIQWFKEIIENKTELILKRKKANKKKLTFIYSIDSIIAELNSNLNIEARQKEQSNKILTELKHDIKSNFRAVKALKNATTALENFECAYTKKISIDDEIDLVLETAVEHSIKVEILDGINSAVKEQSLFYNILRLLFEKSTIKNLGGNTPENLIKKINTQLSDCYQDIEFPKDFLEYSDGESSKEKSPGYNSEKYLEIILKNPLSKTIFIDQPEDNLGNRFISEGLVNILRNIKFQKQIFLVTHNPSIVVYGDAESIILAKNVENEISYKQIVLEDNTAQKEICSILDGGEYIFNNRAQKYNIQRILKEA